MLWIVNFKGECTPSTEFYLGFKSWCQESKNDLEY